MSKSSKAIFKPNPWLMLAIAAVFYSYEFFLRVTPSVLTKDLMHVFNISAQQVGMLSSYYFWAYTPMQLFVGVMLDHYRIRTLLILAITMCTIGAGLFFSEWSFLIAGVGRFAIGFGSAFAFVAVMKIAADWLPSQFFALVSGLTTTLGMLGAIGGELALSHLLIHAGYQYTTIVVIMTGVFIFVVAAFFIRDHHHLRHQTSFTAELQMLWHSILEVASNGQIWISAAIGACLYMPTTFFAGQWAIPYFMDVHGLTQHEAAFLSSLVFVGWAIGAPIVGWLSHVFGRRKPWLMVGTFLAALSSLILLYTPVTYPAIIVLMLCIGIASSSEILVFAIAHDITKNKLTATAMALTNMIVMMGGFVQHIVGILLDWSHTNPAMPYTPHEYQFALSLMPACFIIGWVLCWLLKETFCKQCPDTAT